jgi:site-specific recombinase XerC
VAKVGKIIQQEGRGGRVVWRIDFGLRAGRRVRLGSLPSPVDGRPIGFESREQAERVLDSIRSAMADGAMLEHALAKFRPGTAPEDMVEERLARYVEQFEALVEQGQRSPTTLRELRRYAQPQGHLGFWWGRSVHGIRVAEVEDFHLWLGRRGISAKTQRNVSNVFRTFLRWLRRRGEVERVVDFPAIRVPEHAPIVIDMETQREILDAIPWERRGAFLAAATEALRVGEVRALDLDDYRDGRLHVHKAVQGPRLDAPIRHTKNRSAEWREVWSEDLLHWIAWRLQQATPEARLRGEVALFWNPTARNRARRWTPDPMEKEWRRACEQVGVEVALQEGTRHSILTALGQVLPERTLRAFSRHRDARSLDHYSKPKATRAAIVKALPPRRVPAREGEV